MWMDQRERNSKSVWLWGSILFHAGVAAYFVMSPSADHSPLSSTANASETITMTVAENKSPETSVQQTQAPKIKEDTVALPQKEAKKAKKKKIIPAVKELPKKEEPTETVATKEEKEDDSIKAVVVPVDENEPIKKTELKNIKEQSLDEEVANLKAVKSNDGQTDEEDEEVEQPLAAKSAEKTQADEGQKALPTGATNENKAPQVAEKTQVASSPNTNGTASNPRSYLDLKQKPGNVPPRYPDLARRQGTQGQVELKYFVTEQGSVSNIQIVKSSGSAVLDKEAVDAISRYQYYPGQQGWAAHPVSFSLKGPQQVAPSRLRTAKGN